MRKPRRPRLLVWGCGLLLVLVLVVGAMLAILLQGPVSIGYLARAVEARASSDRAHVTVGSATIDLSSGLPARIELANIAIEVEGDVPLSVVVPRISAPVDLLAALSGRFEVSTITLEQPKLSIQRPESDNTDIPAMETLSLAADSAARLALDQLARRAIERIELVSAEVVAEGAATYRMRGIDAVLTREGDAELKVDAEVAGRLGRWRVGLRHSVDPGSGARLVRIDVDDVTLGEFMPLESNISTGKGLGVPVDIRLDSTLDKDGAFVSTRLSAVVSPGWINTGRSVVAFDKIDMQFAWLAGTPGFQIAPSVYVRGNTVIPFEGVVQPPRDWETQWSYRIVSHDASIAPDDVPGPPYAMETLLVEGQADPMAREIAFNRIALRSGSANLDGAGSLTLRDDGPYLALAMESGPMAVATLKRIWPVTTIPPARDWVIEHMIDGRIDGGRATIALQPPAFDVSDPAPGWSGDDVTVEISFSDLSLKTVGTVPVAQGLDGKLTVSNEVLTVAASDGIMVARAGEQIAVDGIDFSIPDIRESGDKTGVLKLTLDGPVASVATVLDAEPFHVLKQKGITPADVSGSAKMVLSARFPLIKDIDIDTVDWQVSGSLRNFANAKPIEGQRLSRADLAFDVDDRRLELKGKGRLDGLPANLDLVIPLGNGEGAAVAARQGVVLDVSADQLAGRGIDLREFVNGQLRLSSEETETGQSFEIDLARARIDLAQVGWTKSSGVPATARFTMTETGGRREIRGFRLTSEGVEIAGSITLDGAGDLVSAQFNRFALRPNDEATLRIGREGGQTVADFRAARFDGRGLIASLASPGESGKGAAKKPAYRVSADIDQLTGFNGVSLANVTLRMSMGKDGIRALSLNGVSSARGQFQFSLSEEGGGRKLTGSIEDTGALLRFANLYERMRGGRGILSVSMPSQENWSGRFKVKRLAITEDPAIRALARSNQVIDAGSRRKQILAGSERNGEASFSALDLFFERRGDRLTITEGTLEGATIGGTVSGNVNLANRTLDLTGTFVPIFALNNLFAKIPILGFALGGGSDEGLIGVTYKLSGAIGEPVLTVNPASAIAPGIFRKLFEYR
ncbi:AsmA-like C-terminal domain-containing protein [Stappia sp.]|uniref:AsmA-like C-terminal domain-containing protein n=1 Tax=Stappia sp. TaxID=1870903 RepID=UPI003A992FB7